MNCYNISKDFFRFVLNPNQTKYDLTTEDKIKNLGVVFLIKSIIVFFLATLVIWYENIFNISLIKSVAWTNVCNMPLSNQIFFMTICAIFEELTFRLPLRYSKANVSLSIGVLFSSFFFMLSPSGSIPFFRGLLLKIGISLFIFPILLLILRNNSIANKIEALYDRRFKVLVYSWTALFAMMHITNYKPNIQLLLTFHILLLPRFFGGLADAYIRIRQGLIWAILLHILSNAFVICVFRTW